MNSAEVRELAERFAPSLRFCEGERFYPIQVESWLSHVSLAEWPGGPAGRDLPTESATGPFYRGTAIMEASSGAFQPPGIKRGGAPNPAGYPVELSNATDPNAIGNPAYRPRQASAGLFVSFAGWRSPSYQEGCADYLYDAFSELAAAMEPANEWTLFEERENRPHLWHAQPTVPTVYAEAEWAGTFHVVDREKNIRTPGEIRDFVDGPDEISLRKLLVITYHLFFPMRESGRTAGGWPYQIGAAEGQWEAYSVFFTGDNTSSPGEVRPAYDAATMRPYAAVVSRHTVDSRRDSYVVRPWSWGWGAVEHLPVFVSRGDHQLVFGVSTAGYTGGDVSIPTGETPDPGSRLNPTDPGKGDFPGSEVLFVAALIIGGPVGLLLFLAWLASLLFGAHNEEFVGNDPSPLDVPTPVVDGDGSGVSAGPVGSPPDNDPPGTVQASGARVDDPARAILRVINRFDSDVNSQTWAADHSGEPPPTVELPYWWDFAGRWGVIVESGTTWGNGTYRIDRFGRSLGYWNAQLLARAWATGWLPRP